MRYRLNVAATDAADVVTSAGGWLFDRAMAGWDVNVYLADCGDADGLQALKVLGLRAYDLFADLSSPFGQPQVGLAVAGRLVVDDELIRGAVSATLRAARTEVALWGESCTSHLGSRFDPVRYRLSAAAVAFKGHSLVAAGMAGDVVAPTEMLFRGGCRPVDSDLGAFG